MYVFQNTWSAFGEIGFGNSKTEHKLKLGDTAQNGLADEFHIIPSTDCSEYVRKKGLCEFVIVENNVMNRNKFLIQS